MKKILTAILLFCTVFIAGAHNSMRVEAPNIVGLGEQFNVTFIIEGNDRPSDFSWEVGNDFQLVWGPQKGSSTSVQIINGRRSKSSQYTYTYILAPKSTGSFSLQPAIASAGGKTLSSGNISIQVVSDGNSASSNNGNSSGSRTAPSSGNVSSSGEISKDDLFLRFSLNHGNAVIGEPLTAVLKLYQRVDIAGFEGAKFPTFNGFWSQETDAPTNIEFRRETLNDKIYNAAVLRRYVLIPQQAGELVIEPAELVCLVNVRTASRGTSSIFDSFFEDDYTTIRKRLVTPAVTVHVRKLPQGAPASFGGGVGRFSINAKLGKDSLKTHEATSLVVNVSGNGNVALLEAPKINFPPDMETYDIKSSVRTDKGSGGISGTKTFEYPFIPRSHGDFTIDPIEYSYFDVASKQYVTVKTAPIRMKVAKGEENSTSSIIPSSPSSERKGVKSLGEDIRYIVTGKPSMKSGVSFFIASPLFWTILFLLVLAAVICLFIFRELYERRADVVGTKNRKATKMALRRLKQAEDFLKKNLNAAFYEELHKAVLGFASDKLNMQGDEINKDNIAGRLKEGGVPQQLTDRFIALLDACDYSRYSPDSSNESMSAHYAEAVELISSIDTCMKNKKYPGVRALVLLPIMFLMFHPAFASVHKDVRDSLWNAGVSAYSNGEWGSAIAAWNMLEATKSESAVLYYNIGNAYFKAGDYAKSILNYERALKIDPSNSSAGYNLELARTKIKDRIDEVPEFFLVTWTKNVSYLLSSNVWAVLGLVFFAAFLALLLLFILGRSSNVRKTGFYTAIAAFLLCIPAFGFSISQRKAYIKADTAIILSPVTSVKSSPSAESAKDLFVLHEGTKVRILDKVGEWSNIELADGRQGWMMSDSMEII